MSWQINLTSDLKPLQTQHTSVEKQVIKSLKKIEIVSL